MIIDGFSGPGGWCEGARMLGLSRVVGIELDAAACATRAAAGHRTIRADMTGFPVGRLAGKVQGSCYSPPCIVFSAAGSRGGIAVMRECENLIRDMFAGRKTRARWRTAMAAALRDSDWPGQKMRPTKYGGRKHPTPIRLTREQRSAMIRKAVLSASLVAEPARFIAASRPEWVALEQVPSVLPLWQVYADELRKMGYSAWCGKLNAANYGVPQTRERAILIASRVRKVSCPAPTHYDPRRGAQLFGEPWVSMAIALGWGATDRPPPTVTAGGTSAGGAEPFGHRDRDALEAEREAGRWALRRSRGEGMLDREGRGGRRDHPVYEPAPTITSAGSKPGAGLAGVLHTNRGQAEDGTRQTVDPSTAPAPALTAEAGGQWTVKSFRNNNTNNACERSLDEPAGTLFFGHRSNWAAWVVERPAPTIVTTRRSQGGLIAGRQLPAGEGRSIGGHGWDGESTSSKGGDAVRITVQEAAILQSFPADYPWQGTKTAQFTQVGNAIPPVLAMHILAEATGVAIADVTWGAA